MKVAFVDEFKGQDVSFSRTGWFNATQCAASGICISAKIESGVIENLAGITCFEALQVNGANFSGGLSFRDAPILISV